MSVLLPVSRQPGPGGAGLACQVPQRARSLCQLFPSCGLQIICSQVPSLGGRAGRRESQNKVTPGLCSCTGSSGPRTLQPLGPRVGRSGPVSVALS